MIFKLIAFLGSFLLFQLELIVGQSVLPLYGGSYYVWTTCLLFFQAVLVAGYAYALALSERLSARRFLLPHLALLAASVVLMPSGFLPQGAACSVGDLLWRLVGFIALPFLLLSASTTLCQRAYSDSASSGGEDPYPVFAWSNVGSLAGMLAHSLVLEPALPLSAVFLIWRAAFAFYALCFASALFSAWRSSEVRGELAGPCDEERPYFRWFILPAGTTALLSAVTNYQSSATASVPLTWMIPLCVYLLSFALLFGRKGLSVNTLRAGVFILLLALAGLLWHFKSPVAFILIALLNWALLFACLIAHRELYLAKPRSPALAPRYYLMMGLGGVAGTALVTPLAALHLSFGFADLYLALLLYVAAMAYASAKDPRAGRRLAALSAALLTGLLLLCRAFSGRSQVYGVRNFYGIYRVEDDRKLGLRRFIHGSTVHGIQHLDAKDELKTTVYYSAESPISEVLGSYPAKRVGAVGLGVGVSCADAKAGTSWTFYEIDPDVVDIARRYFTFLSKCKAEVSVRTGDARLLLAREPEGRFDLLYLDAFSGGSVPFHLLSREAVELYRSRLKPGGVMVFHISENFLDLVPALRLATSAAGLQSLYKRASFDPEDPARLSSEWLVATSDAKYLRKLSMSGWQRPDVPAGWKVWTDDYHNVLKAVKFH